MEEQQKMYRQKFSLFLLATALVVAWAEQSSIAFTITPRQPSARYSYRYSRRYPLPDNGRGITFLNAWPFYDPRSILFPGQVTRLERGGTDGFLSALEPFTDLGWTFTPAENDLSGIFDVEYYFPCGTLTACGSEIVPPARGGVGAYFQLKYYPRLNDPTGNEVHWIQRVISNYDQINEQVPIDKIDVPIGVTDTPYYDDYFLAGPNFFIDRPYNNVPDANHYFFAELYLVEETGPQTVTIYNGVRWGWKNRVTRRPSPPCPGNTGGGGCDGGGGSSGGGGTTSNFRDREVPLFENDDDEAAEDLEKIPETTSLLGLFALSSWEIFQWLKNRKDK